MAGQLLVEMRRVTKRFPGVVANDQVNLGLVEGEPGSVFWALFLPGEQRPSFTPFYPSP